MAQAKDSDLEPKQSAGYQRISLVVGDMRLRMSVPRRDESLFRLAGEEIEQTLQIYRGKYTRPSERDETRLLAMSCVDIAYRSLCLREEELRYRGLERLTLLNGEIERELAEHLLLSEEGETSLEEMLRRI